MLVALVTPQSARLVAVSDSVYTALANQCTVWTHLTQPEPCVMLPDLNTTGYWLR